MTYARGNLLTKEALWYIYDCMRAISFTVAAAALLLGACQTYDHSCITEVSDIPLKTAEEPGTDWASAPLRSHAMYVLYGAESEKERTDCVGDYYFVTWYDAEPTKPVRVVMRYTQASTGANELRVEKEYTQARAVAGSHTERFFFAGEERRKRGDVLTWKMELYVDGKLADSTHSYLWQEK